MIKTAFSWIERRSLSLLCTVTGSSCGGISQPRGRLFHQMMKLLMPVHPLPSPRRLLSVSVDDPRVQAYAGRVRAELRQLEEQLASGRAAGAAASRRQRHLSDTAALLDELERLADERRQLAELLADAELRELAEQEAARLAAEAARLQAALLSRLAGAAPADECAALLELSAGVGGQEAMLFAGELLEMYLRYAARRGWRAELAEHDATGLGGVRSAVATVHGDGAFARLRHEGGVHRVQRVPRTERSGRLHTSTVAVAVLPLPEAVDVALAPAELRIETKRASGAGGQHVNTTDSAVRVVHLPTGLAVECQQMRSQHRNKERALEILRARLYQRELERAEQERASARKRQVGSSGRSEKIRTYNFPQDRVTDHRLGLSLHGVQLMLAGERLDEFVDRLRELEQHQRVLDELGEPADAAG